MVEMTQYLMEKNDDADAEPETQNKKKKKKYIGSSTHKGIIIYRKFAQK